MKSTARFRYFSLLTFLLVLSATVIAQNNTTKTERTRKTASKEVMLNRAPEGRGRKAMGDGDGDRASSRIRNARPIGKEQIEDELRPKGKLTIDKLTKAAGTFGGDLRSLPFTEPEKRERPERERPLLQPGVAVPPLGAETGRNIDKSFMNSLLAAVPAPTPSQAFDGLDFANWGDGHPPDPNGDVGPKYYIQTINTSVGIYDKSTNTRVAAFTFNTLMSQGAFGNLCDTDNFGDPVVIYDTFEDRWVITDFAFQLDNQGNVVNPPGSFQCFAVSKSGDPVNGGWNFYSINTTGGLGDYPKFGVWTDGIYMSANMFGYKATDPYLNPRVYAFNKAQMYAGSPTVQVLSFDATTADFTIIPSNARLQTGTPPAGRPAMYVGASEFLNALTVYKFHVDWNRPTLSTFTGPDIQMAPTCWPDESPANAATPANSLDTLALRSMVQNQYSNIGGSESLWLAHTVERGESANNTTCNASVGNLATPRWYQLNVNGGTVASNVVQGKTWDPDGTNTFFRYLPSVAVDHVGDMAMGYSKSNATTNPQIKYAGRLASDPINTFSQTEQTLIDGTASQNGSCGGTCIRWGDYSAMTLDPDGCTFWYTNEYYTTNGLNFLTRIGAFAYPSCTAFLNNGSLQGTVTSAATGAPLQGVTVSLGVRSTTTDGSGHYSILSLPRGLYPTASAAFSGYMTGTASNISINDANITNQDFALSVANDSNCFTDTTQADFQTGTLSNIDVAASPGNVTLAAPSNIDQQNTSLGTSGVSFSDTTWLGQTFTPAVSGKITRVDLNLFSLNCDTVTMPNVTISIRNAASNLPTGADLATATIPGACDADGGFFVANFASPVTVTSGTQYALVWRASAPIPSGSPAPAYLGSVSPSSGGPSVTNPYAGGRRASSADSGSTWAGASGNANNDHGFKIYVQGGFAASGNFMSSTKDSNAAAPGTAVWGSISWNATVPASTTLKFQAAASNNQFGPFSFVGPDGTSGTFFTNGASLSQFNGKRYLEYEALMSTTDTTKTPTLSDVTICDTNPRVWTGAVNTDWNNAGNWSSSGVPGSSDAAIIPSTGVLNNPSNTTSASVGTLILGSGRIVTTGGNSLTITNCSPSAVTGGDTSSFVNGTLIRCVNPGGPYVFPVGTNNGFAPVTFGNIVGTGNFLVGPADGTVIGADPTQSLTRYWTITPTGPTQADITLAYQASDVPGGANESSFKFLRQTGSGTSAINPTTFNTATHTFTLNSVTAFSNWSLGTPLAPTAAGVTVSGRAVRSSGVGVNGAIVTLMDSDGNVRTTRTNGFGYFSFGDVMVGRTYIVSIQSKQFQFAPQTLMVTDSIADLSFVANP
jgi:hypothetical protein